VVRVNIFKDHRQTIAYILPTDGAKLAQAELLAIDEAAAIPLPLVKSLLGPYLVFLSSTVNGYEGTGRALSLKLINQLRAQQGAAAVSSANLAASSIPGAKEKKGERKVHEDRWKAAAEAASRASGLGARSLKELSLTTPIRYTSGDDVETWLNSLLCLDCSQHASRIVSSLPAPKDCDLYLVDRDALFSYHALAESLLQRVWALYTSAHYKNTPNDLQMLSDAPAHRLFVLLGPQGLTSNSLPEVLCGEDRTLWQCMYCCGAVLMLTAVP
jgi:N-acetyltransferase 10